MYAKKSYSIATFICTLAAMFYLYEFSLQVSLGVMTHELMLDMGLNATSLGMVSAFYYYAYTPMQIPAGLLHDKYGPRRMLTVAVLACALGALFFGFSQSMIQASIGRLLMGAGSAFSFTGALLLIARWFPPTYFAVLSGVVQLMSSVGAIGGELPLAVAIRHWGWRDSMLGLAILGLILAYAIWHFVRDFPSNDHATTSQKIVRHIQEKPQGLKQILQCSETWWIAGYSFLIWAPVTAFAGLWGVPFLVAAKHLSTESASVAIAIIWIGIGIGSPLSGWISEYLQKRSNILTLCGALGLVASVMIIYVSLPLIALYGFLFVLGLSCGGQSLAFCVVRDISHPSSIGTSIGINNMATVASGAILQPIIGWLLCLNWNGALLDHAPIYSLSDYRIGLLMIPICYALATFISVRRIGETNCQPRYSIQHLIVGSE